MEKYQLCFGLTCRSNAATIAPPTIYFNYQKDFLCFREDRIAHSYSDRSCYEPFSQLANQLDLDKVQRLAFQSQIPTELYWNFSTFRTDLDRWKSLKEVCWGDDAAGISVSKRIDFKRLDGNEFEFAKSCKHKEDDDDDDSEDHNTPFIPRSPGDIHRKATRENVGELLETVKHYVETGYILGMSEGEPEPAEAQWEVNFGSFQNP